jgi:hypothetical protein
MRWACCHLKSARRDRTRGKGNLKSLKIEMRRETRWEDRILDCSCQLRLQDVTTPWTLLRKVNPTSTTLVWSLTYEAPGRVPYSQCTSLLYSQTHPNPLGGHIQPLPQPSLATRTARQTKFHHLLSDLWDTYFDAQYGHADQIQVGEELSKMIEFLIEITATDGSLTTVATRPGDLRLL